MSVKTAIAQGKALAESDIVGLPGEEPLTQIAEAVANLLQYATSIGLSGPVVVAKAVRYVVADHEEDE